MYADMLSSLKGVEAFSSLHGIETVRLSLGCLLRDHLRAAAALAASLWRDLQRKRHRKLPHGLRGTNPLKGRAGGF